MSTPVFGTQSEGSSPGYLQVIHSGIKRWPEQMDVLWSLHTPAQAGIVYFVRCGQGHHWLYTSSGAGGGYRLCILMRRKYMSSFEEIFSPLWGLYSNSSGAGANLDWGHSTRW